jgi:hypothetical protein
MGKSFLVKESKPPLVGHDRLDARINQPIAVRPDTLRERAGRAARSRTAWIKVRDGEKSASKLSNYLIQEAR